MITDCTEGKLKEAKKHPLAETLNQSLEALERISTNLKAEIKIYNDWAPLSFMFSAYPKNTLHGGIIFHGEHDGFGDGSAPTFSVCVEKADGWRIHT